VAELGIPILYHPERVSNFHMIASEYPRLTMIMAHLGNFASRGWTEHIAAIEVARRYPNVWVGAHPDGASSMVSTIFRTRPRSRFMVYRLDAV